MKQQICFSASAEVKKFLQEKKEKTGYSVSSLINAIILEKIHKEYSKDLHKLPK